MTPTITMGLIALCLAFEGFFSGSEMALVQANRLSLQAKADDGDPGAKLAMELLQDEHRLFATCLIGTNLSVVTWSTLATGLLLRFGLEAWGAILLVPLGLVVGEAVPKALFQAKADELATVVAQPISWARSLFSPALSVVAAWDRVLRRWFQPEVGADISRQELLDMLDSDEEGPIPERERRLIRGVLALSDTTACDCMTPLVQVIAVPDSATVAAAAETAVRTRHSRLPVFRRRIDHIVGLVHQVDLLYVASEAEPITTHMRPVRFVPEHKRADDLFREMRSEGEHFAVVVDEYGGCIGIVSLEDLLEELVGDIEDERAVARPKLQPQADGSFIAPGPMESDTANDALGITLPDGPYETLAGLLLYTLGRIPQAGESIEIDGVKLIVEDATDRAVTAVRVIQPPSADS